MPALLFIPFAVFFCCCAAQFYFLRRIRAALAERHPEVWREISVKAWSIDSAVGKFVWRGAKNLNDADLTTKVNQLRVLYIVAFAAWLTFATVLITGVGFPR